MAISAPETLSPDAAARLDGMLTRLAAGRGVRHAIVAIARSDGSPLWLEAMGAADEAGSK